MANNRLYIQCTVCGDAIMIAKHFGGAWELRGGFEKADAIDRFFADHFITCGNHCFRLADDFNELDYGVNDSTSVDDPFIEYAKGWRK